MSVSHETIFLNILLKSLQKIASFTGLKSLETPLFVKCVYSSVLKERKMMFFLSFRQKARVSLRGSSSFL